MTHKNSRPVMEIMRNGIDGMSYDRLNATLNNVNFDQHVEHPIDRFDWTPSLENELKLMQDGKNHFDDNQSVIFRSSHGVLNLICAQIQVDNYVMPFKSPVYVVHSHINAHKAKFM